MELGPGDPPSRSGGKRPLSRFGPRGSGGKTVYGRLEVQWPLILGSVPRLVSLETMEKETAASGLALAC